MPSEPDPDQDKTTVSSQPAGQTTHALAQHSLVDGIYKIDREIGTGGAGSVYQVEQVALKKTFALKVLHDTYSDITMRRFHKEAQIAASLDHPNLVRAVHSGTLPDGKPFYIMDFVSGMTLAERLEEGPLRPAEIIQVFLPLCVALDYAHSQGLVHRDLKPGNTVLTVENGKVVPKIIDFGIAHLALSETAGGANLTRTGEIFGTPKYMSPEQSLSKKVDQRSDVYSLGCMIFECLTGKVPFTGENAVATIMLHVTAPPQLLRDAAPDRQFAYGWQELINQILAKEPEDRFQSCAQVAHALEAIRDNTVALPVKRKGPTPIARKGLQPAAIASICAALLLVTTGGVVFFSQHNASSSTATLSSKSCPSANALQSAALKYAVSETYLQKALHAARQGDWLNALTASMQSFKNLQEHLPKVTTPDDDAALSIRNAITSLAYSNNGMVAKESQRLKDALIFINLAITQDPYVSEYLLIRGNINTKLDKKDDAAADFAKAKILAQQPSTDCDRIIRSITASGNMFNVRVSGADPAGQKYQRAKNLLLTGKWREAHDALFSLIVGLLDDAQAHNANVDVRRCGLYYSLVSYALYRQAEAAGDDAKILTKAIKRIDEAIHYSALPADIYRIKSLILRKQHQDDLAKENDEIFTAKQRDNGDPQVNDELHVVLNELEQSPAK